MIKRLLAMFFLAAMSLSSQTPVNGDHNASGNWQFGKNVNIGGPVPLIDIAVSPYNARPLPTTDSLQMTRGSSSGTSLSVASPGDFQVNDGIVVSKAGAATSQSTPLAPSVTPIGTKGLSTICYELVGADSLEGLTPAGSSGCARTDPSIFGTAPIVLSSIFRSRNTVSVTTSSAMPFSSGTYHVFIVNVRGGTTDFNGLQVITITGSRTFTYSQTGANESGTTSSISSVVFKNAFVITSITRTGTVITVQTDVNHNFVVGSSQYPTLVEIYGVQPTDLDGWYRVATVPTPNTFTIDTGYSVRGTEIGMPLVGNTDLGGYAWNKMGVYSWESNLLTGPALSGNTQFYYVYADYLHGGSGPFNLVGATLPGQNTFRDWGPWQGVTGYTPPPAAQVPSTAPASAQNEEYVGTIVSINGSTFTVSPAIPSTVTSQPVFHDQSLAIQAADNEACKAESAIVYFSGPSAFNSILNQLQMHVWNAPFLLKSTSVCTGLQWYLGTELVANDTASDNASAFNLQNYSSGHGPNNALNAIISGYGNPLINAAWQSAGAYPIFVKNITFAPSGNGQLGVFANGEYSTFEKVGFSTGYNSTSVGGIFWSPFEVTLRDSTWQGQPNYEGLWGFMDGMPIPGGPPFPNLVFWEDFISSAYVLGSNNSQGKGIEFVASPAELGASGGFDNVIENIITDQAPLMPVVLVYGNMVLNNLTVRNSVADTILSAGISNIGCTSCGQLHLDQQGAVWGDAWRSVEYTSEYPYGDPLANYLGQNISTERPLANEGPASLGPWSTSSPTTIATTRQTTLPFIFRNSAGNYPLAWEQSVTGVRATTSGSGTFTAGLHTLCVLPVGWNGGDSGEENGSCTTVTTNGSQGIQGSWTALPSAMGYDVFIDGYRQNSAIISESTTTETYGSSGAGALGTEPTQPGTGCPLIDQNGLDCTPSVRLAGVYTVSTLPSASANPGLMVHVTDSTTISAEGQRCVGSSTNHALAFSNGSVWKCF